MTTRTNSKDPAQKGSIVRFLRGVKTELSKVNWPTLEEMRTHVLVVLVMCLLMSVITGMLDRAFHEVIRVLFKL